MTFWQTVIVALTALTSAFISAFLTTYLQRRNEQIKFIRDKLIDRYSEFVAICSADLSRANIQASIAQTYQAEQDYKDLIHGTYQSMKSNQLELARLSLQIRLLESDEELKKKVKELEKSQPFMMFLLPPQWNDISYKEQFNKFESEINLFEQNLSDLVNTILAKQKAKKTLFYVVGFFN